MKLVRAIVTLFAVSAGLAMAQQGLSPYDRAVLDTLYAKYNALTSLVGTVTSATNTIQAQIVVLEADIATALADAAAAQAIANAAQLTANAAQLTADAAAISAASANAQLTTQRVALIDMPAESADYTVDGTFRVMTNFVNIATTNLMTVSPSNVMVTVSGYYMVDSTFSGYFDVADTLRVQIFTNHVTSSIRADTRVGTAGPVGITINGLFYLHVGNVVDVRIRCMDLTASSYHSVLGQLRVIQVR